MNGRAARDIYRLWRFAELIGHIIKMNRVWSLEYSVLCPVSTEFAWEFWTNVSNWALDADVESVELDGDFRPGARGVTVSRSSGRIEWRIAETQAGRAVIEFEAPGALAILIWAFANQQGGTKITQCATFVRRPGDGICDFFRKGIGNRYSSRNAQTV
jgi:hypothetical protein